MARIVIRSPLLDLKLADGSLVPNAVESTDEEKNELRRDVGKSTAESFAAAMQILVLADQSIRQFVGEGLYIDFEDAPEEDLSKATRVPLDVPALACGVCRKPATGVQMRGVCSAHGLGPAKKAAAS